MKCGEIRFRVSRESGITDLDLIDGWIRDRYEDILTNLRWKRRRKVATIETTAGEPVYALPADCRVVESLRDVATDWPLTRNAEYPESATGAPLAFRQTFDSETDPPVMQVRLSPVPDSVRTIEVEYTAVAGTFVTPAADVSLLPWVQEGCLVAGVLSDAFAHAEAMGKADREERKFLSRLESMIRTEHANRGQQSLRLASRYAPSWR